MSGQRHQRDESKYIKEHSPDFQKTLQMTRMAKGSTREVMENAHIVLSNCAHYVSGVLPP